MAIFGGKQATLNGRRCGPRLSAALRALERKIKTGRAVVGVVGQGYVGFPLAQRIAECGYTTVGYDISGGTIERCKAANRFRTYQAVRSAVELAACDVIVIAVPTPTRELANRREPDLSLVTTAVRTALAHLPEDWGARLLVVESTYAPGTTRAVVAPMLEAKRERGVEIDIGYSHERIDL